MIILFILILLISNAVSLRRDMSILSYIKIAIITLLYAILQSLISFPLSSNGVIGINEIDPHLINIREILLSIYFIVLVLLIFIHVKNFFLDSLCRHFYKDISIFTFLGTPFLVIYKIKNFYKNNKAFFFIKNYVFLQLGKTELCIVLYMFIYITIVILPLFFYYASFSISMNFIFFNKVELLALFYLSL